MEDLRIKRHYEMGRRRNPRGEEPAARGRRKRRNLPFQGRIDHYREKDDEYGKAGEVALGLIP